MSRCVFPCGVHGSRQVWRCGQTRASGSPESSGLGPGRPLESHRAAPALLTSLRALVLAEAGAPAEAPAAVKACVGLLARVCPAVRAEVQAAVEALPALGAGVGPLAGVHPAVDDQARALAEVLPALGAGVGLLTRVHALVRAAVGAVPEALPAHLALVGPLARLRVLVLGQVRRLTKGLAALGARVWLLQPAGPPYLQGSLGSDGGQSPTLTGIRKCLAPSRGHQCVLPVVPAILELRPKLWDRESTMAEGFTGTAGKGRLQTKRRRRVGDPAPQGLQIPLHTPRGSGGQSPAQELKLRPDAATQQLTEASQQP